MDYQDKVSRVPTPQFTPYKEIIEEEEDGDIPSVPELLGAASQPELVENSSKFTEIKENQSPYSRSPSTDTITNLPATTPPPAGHYGQNPAAYYGNMTPTPVFDTPITIGYD